MPNDRSPAQFSHFSTPQASDIGLIQQLNAEYFRSQLSRDVPAFARLLAEDYVVIGPYGAVRSKADRLAWLGDAANTIDRLVSKEEQVRVYGDLAVVQSMVRGTGTSGGRPYDVTGRDTHWYAHRGNTWTMIAAQRSPVGPQLEDLPLDASETEVRSLDDQLLSAHRAHDAALADGVLADDFVAVGNDGTVGNKASELAAIQANTALTTLEVEEVRVCASPAAATVVSLVRFQSAGGDGHASTGRVRLAHVYVRRGGRWKVVLGQGTPVKSTGGLMPTPAEGAVPD